MTRWRPLLILEQRGTPQNQRGALWWMREHKWAEQAVTLASKALDSAASDRERELWSRLLDVRLDHLERVEDECDRILDSLRSREPAWVAEAAESYYVKGTPLVDVAHALHRGRTYVSATVPRALERLDRIG